MRGAQVLVLPEGLHVYIIKAHEGISSLLYLLLLLLRRLYLILRTVELDLKSEHLLFVIMAIRVKKEQLAPLLLVEILPDGVDAVDLAPAVEDGAELISAYLAEVIDAHCPGLVAGGAKVLEDELDHEFIGEPFVFLDLVGAH